MPACLEHDPGYLEQHKVKVFLLQNVGILAAEVISGTGAPGLSLGLVRVGASSEIRELRLHRCQCPLGRLGLGLWDGDKKACDDSYRGTGHEP